MRNLTRSQKSVLSSHATPSRETGQVNLKYHRLRCEICRHDLCQQIEEAFLQWRSPKVIMHCFGIKTETTIDHHAPALGPLNLRDQGLRHALGNIIEDADTLRPTNQDILRAIYALAHINDQGQWVHPTNKSEAVVSSNRTAAATLPSSAYVADASRSEQLQFTPAPPPLQQPDPAPAPLSSLATHHSSPPHSIASETKSKVDANP